MRKRLDLVGQKFGRLEVIADAGNSKWHSSLWLCRCDCGNEKIIIGNNLKKGHINSCGCLRNEIVSKRITIMNKNRKVSLETCKKMSEAHKGEKSYNWKGDKVSSFGLHMWINKWYPRNGICSQCGKEGYTEYANISGEYKRDKDDFIELCVPCHRKLDKKEEDYLFEKKEE